MIFRVLPARQRTLIELLDAIVLAIVDGIVHHDALVVELLTKSFDGLAVDADALDIFPTATAVLGGLLVVQTEVVFGDFRLLDLGLSVARAVVVEVAVEDLDVLVAIGTLVFVLHASGMSVRSHYKGTMSEGQIGLPKT